MKILHTFHMRANAYQVCIHIQADRVSLALHDVFFISCSKLIDPNTNADGNF